MGIDLWIALGFIASVAGVAFLAGRRFSLSVSQERPRLFAECLALSLVFAFGFSNRLGWADTFDSAAALYWSNWMPVLLGLTAGLASEIRFLRPRVRRATVASIASLAAGFLLLPVARPLLAPIEIRENARWRAGVCLQSHAASCGPAAAATLLHQTAVMNTVRLTFDRGRWATAPLRSAERLMAKACLTSEQGTSSLGLIRGLRLALAGSQRRVEVADTDPSLWPAKDQLPNLAVVRFAPQGGDGPVRRLLGRGREGHAVVVHSRTADGRWRVADPAVGWRSWSDREFRRVFTGEAIYLAPRSFAESSDASALRCWP